MGNSNFGNDNIYQTQYYPGSAGINQLIGNTQVHQVNSPEYIYNVNQQQQQNNQLRDSLSSASRGTPQQQNQRTSSKSNAAQSNPQRQSMGVPNTVVHQSSKLQNSSKPMYEQNPMTGGDADFVYNNLMSQANANNNQVNNLGSNVQGYTMNAANLNMHRKTASKGGAQGNTIQQRNIGGSFRQPSGQFSSFQNQP